MADERIFISYARADGAGAAADLRNELERLNHSVWQDLVAMRSAADWWAQIEFVLRTSALQHFILIVTPGALASPVVRSEIRLARQEGKSVHFVKGPGLDFGTVPRWFGHVCDLAIPEHRATLLAQLLLKNQQPRVPMMAPEPPEDYVHRPIEFDALKKQLLDANGDAIAITAALKGAGGYGKTTLAKKLSHDPDVQDAYFDGVLWVELGERPQNLLGQISDLVTRLSGRPPQLETINAAASALAEALGERRILLVVDDVWREQDLLPFLQGGRRTTRLITTRIDRTAPASAFRQKVDALDTRQAISLLANGLAPNDIVPLGTQLEKLAARLGEWPLVLKLVNGFMRQRVERFGEPIARALEGVVERLDANGLVAFDPKDEAQRNRAVAKTIRVSLDILEPSSRDRFLELAVFPEDTDIPIDLVTSFWTATAGTKRLDGEDILAYLEGLSLLLALDLSRKTLRLHDTIRHYLRYEAGNQLADFNRQLVTALDVEVSRPKPDPATRAYFFAQLMFHLEEAGDLERVHALLTDPRWLVDKLASTASPISLAEDYQNFGATGLHMYLGRCVRLATGILTRDPSQLLTQLVARLALCEDQDLETFIKRAAQVGPRPGLTVTSPTFTPPGAEQTRLQGHRGRVAALAVLADGRLASSSSDRIIRVWDVDTATEIARLSDLEEEPQSLFALPSGELAWRASSHSIATWDTSSATPDFHQPVGSDDPQHMVSLPGGRLLVAATGRLVVFKPGCLENELEIPVISLQEGPAAIITELEFPMGGGKKEPTEKIDAICALPDDRFAVSISRQLPRSQNWERRIHIWDLSGAELLNVKVEFSVDLLCPLPGERLLVQTKEDDRILNTRTGELLPKLQHGRPSWGQVVILPDGRAVSANYNSMVIWNPSTGEALARLDGHIGAIASFVALPDGRIVSGGADRHMTVWNALEDQAPSDRKHTGRVTSLSHLPGRVVSASNDGTIRIWDADGLRDLGSFPAESQINAVVALTDGQVATGGYDTSIRVWDIEQRKQACALQGHTGWVHALAELPNGQLASGGDDRVIRIWDADRSGSSREIRGHTGSVKVLAVLPNGRLISGSEDKTVRIWNPTTGKEFRRLTQHDAWIRALAVLADSSFLSSASDNTICHWSADGDLIEKLGVPSWIRAIDVTTDGHVVTSSDDRIVRVWSHSPLKQLCQLELDAAAHAIRVTGAGDIVVGDLMGRLHSLRMVKGSA